MRIYAPLRSALYVPATNRRAIEKTADISADWIIFDLEDSVGVERKASAREALKEAFNKRNFGESHAAIRCNAVGSAELEPDLRLIAVCRPDVVLIPKVSSVDEVQVFSEQAAAAGLSHDIGCWFMIETASGIVRLGEIIKAASAMPWILSGLVVGHNDLASETGVALTQDRKYLIPWLMQIVLQAKNADIQVVDSVFNNFRDSEGFEKESMQGRQMGFDGKTLIHPDQVDIANRLFSPDEDEIARARRIVDAFSDPSQQQANVLAIDGEMVERLHLQQAQRLLAKAGLQ